MGRTAPVALTPRPGRRGRGRLLERMHRGRRRGPDRGLHGRAGSRLERRGGAGPERPDAAGLAGRGRGRGRHPGARRPGGGPRPVRLHPRRPPLRDPGRGGALRPAPAAAVRLRRPPALDRAGPAAHRRRPGGRRGRRRQHLGVPQPGPDRRALGAADLGLAVAGRHPRAGRGPLPARATCATKAPGCGSSPRSGGHARRRPRLLRPAGAGRRRPHAALGLGLGGRPDRRRRTGPWLGRGADLPARAVRTGRSAALRAGPGAARSAPGAARGAGRRGVRGRDGRRRPAPPGRRRLHRSRWRRPTGPGASSSTPASWRPSSTGWPPPPGPIRRRPAAGCWTGAATIYRLGL